MDRRKGDFKPALSKDFDPPGRKGDCPPAAGAALLRV
jgi:hypothetical protein